MPFLANGGHGGGAAGFEALVLAVPMVVVGVILFFQKTTKPIVPLGLVLGGFAVAVGGFTFLQPDDHSDAPGASDAEVAYGEMVGSLCDAQDAAAAGDFESARTIFLDDVHVRLHGLADRLSDDRAVAARLLEAKQAVEADLDDDEVDAADVPASSDALARDLGELAAAATAGLATLDVEVDGCE